MSGKCFQIINDPDYGFMNSNFVLGVNIELLWEETKNENKFIKLYGEIYQHETVHSEISKIIFNYYNDEEEIIVELMVDGN